MIDHIKLLTARESEILYLIADGKSSKQIGDLLKISHHTVDTHRRKILKKTCMKNMHQLLAQVNFNQITRISND